MKASWFSRTRPDRAPIVVRTSKSTFYRRPLLGEQRDDLAREKLDLALRRVDRPEDQRVESVGVEGVERLRPPVGWSGQRLAGLDVPDLQPADRWRPALADQSLDIHDTPYLPRVAARRQRGFVDPPVALAEVIASERTQRRDPAVRLAADQPLHPGPEGTQPDTNRVNRARARAGALQPVVVSVEGDPLLLRPHQPDDLDGFFQRIYAFGGAASWAAHSRDVMPVRARPQSQLETAAAGDVERGRSLGHDRGRSERQVGDVGEESDPVRLREQRGDQGEGIEEASLVRVVLDADVVEAGLVGQPHQSADTFQRIDVRDDREAS